MELNYIMIMMYNRVSVPVEIGLYYIYMYMHVYLTTSISIIKCMYIPMLTNTSSTCM